MLSNTIDIDYNGVSRTFTRVNQDKYSSEYRAAWTFTEGSAKARMSIRHTSYVDNRKVPVDRHNIEIINEFTLNSDPSKVYREKAYLVFEGDSSAPVASQPIPAIALRDTITDSVLLSMAGWES